MFYRKIIGDVLAGLPYVEVVGTAHNGKAALTKIASLKPDLLTLDIEMPEMDGLEVLAQIKTAKLDVGAIILSTLTQEGGEMTVKALELGAFDFIPKPQAGSMSENTEAIKNTTKKIMPHGIAMTRCLINILPKPFSFISLSSFPNTG